jgi:hypothetical protein
MEKAANFWTALPGILWFLLALAVLLVLRKDLLAVVRMVAWRLRSGAALKIGAFEVATSRSVPNAAVLASRGGEQARADAGGVRDTERDEYYARTRRVMLVHQLFRSNASDQVYDALIYVVPHSGASLAGVSRVEYFFGRMWNSIVFSSADRGRGFPIVTSAYGPFLCTAEVFFNDGESVILHRFIDFEMGAFAPAIQDDAEQPGT